MDAMTIVWIALGVVLLIVVFRFIKRLFSVAVSFIGIIAVVWLVIIGLRYADETNLRNNLVASNNLFLLQDSGDLMTGFATDGSVIDLISMTDFTDPDSPLYDEYYKIIIIQKESLPEKISLVYDASETTDQQALFQSYVKNNIINDDFVDTLVEKERQGELEVYRKTMAFRKGIKEVLDL